VDPHFTLRVKSAVTVPLFTTVTVTVTFWPTVAVTVGETVTELIVGIAETVTETWKLFVRAPLVAVTSTVYAPGAVDDVEDTVRVRVRTRPGVRLTTKLVPLELESPTTADGAPAEGETDVARVTVPIMPRLFSVMVDVAEPPAIKEDGAIALWVMVKSKVTDTKTIAVRKSKPLVPVTNTP